MPVISCVLEAAVWSNWLWLFSQFLQAQLVFCSSVLMSSLQQVSTASKPGKTQLSGLISGCRKSSGVTWIVSMSSLWLLLFIQWAQVLILLFPSPPLFCIFSTFLICLSCLEALSTVKAFTLWTLWRSNCILCSTSLATGPSNKDSF